MYSYLEIETIFNNCSSWDELQKVCSCFITLIALGDLSDNQKIFISLKSNERFRQIENL